MFGHDGVESDDQSHDGIENKSNDRGDHDKDDVERNDNTEETVTGGEELNIQGVFLHVPADALGSVVVLVSASVIWLTDWEYKDYLDPVLSLVIVLLICASTWPLLRESVFILLNSIPAH